jgi:2-C-methyl-D-erythritol 4-phosphate cytidylyltransferase
LTRVCALIPAAGRGARFGGSENKIFAPILGRPLLAWTLEAFARCEAVESVLLVGNAADLPRLREISERWGGTCRHPLPRGWPPLTPLWSSFTTRPGPA